MRLIDADALEAIMRVAINGMKLTAKLFGISGEDEVSATLKAYEDILDGIKEQPTVEAVDGWISVEDRLPKIGNTVLATRFISKDHTYVDMSSYQGQDIGWKSNFDTYYGTNPYKVMAWRPLPKPYKPKEDTQ